jgi:hypothetical protein
MPVGYAVPGFLLRLRLRMLRTKSAAASNDKLYATPHKPVNPGIELPPAV